MSTGIQLTPYPSKFQINLEPAGQDKYWSQTTKYDDLLFANGQHLRDYADLNHVAKGLMYSKLGITESTSLSPLFEYVTGDGGVEEIDKNFARWRIYGTPERRALSFGNLNQVSYPGIGGLKFTLWLDVDWFREGDTLSPVSNKRVWAKIESDAEPFDGAYKYEATLIDGNEAAFIDDEYFAAGEYWVKGAPITSWEKAGTAGSIQFGEGFSFIEFETALTTSEWEFEIEAEAHRQWGNIEITRLDDQENPIIGSSKITNYHEQRAQAQIQYEKELALTYGTATDHLIDRNTRKQITTSPGIFEFFEEGNQIFYNPETQGVDFIVDQIESLWFDRVAKENRELLLLTGQAGQKIFSEWVAEKFANEATTYMWDFVLQTRKPFDDKGGRKGFSFAKPQFVEYHLPTYGVIKIAHWSLLDNTRINGVKYPGSFYPISSYEFVAFNIGFGEPNVKFLARRDNKISLYIPGLWSPIGAVGPDNPIYKTPVPSKNGTLDESYRWLHKESYGVVLLDASATAWFRPNVG